MAVLNCPPSSRRGNKKQKIFTFDSLYLGSIECTGLERSADTQATLEAAGVVVGDISSDHVRQSLPASKPPAIVALPLADAPDPLHEAVVNALAHPGHALGHPGGGQLVMENLCGVLESPVAVEQGMGVGVYGNGLIQGIVGQGGVVGVPQGKRHDPPVAQVQDSAQIELPHRGARIVAELCHICEPLLIEAVRMEVRVQQVPGRIQGARLPLVQPLAVYFIAERMPRLRQMRSARLSLMDFWRQRARSFRMRR